jgi:SAM-dependent methyltransferase
VTVGCRICGADAEVFHVFPRRALFNKPLATPEPLAAADFPVGYCRKCRHVSAEYESTLDESVLERIYTDLYVHHPPSGLSPSQARWTEFVADRVASWLPEHPRVLEVGCHDGSFLALLRDRGADVVGIEPSPFADAARERGIEVHQEFFDPSRFDTASFDVVVARHVVEHLERPLSFLDSVAAIARPGGLVYVEVPNSLASIEERFYPEFHVDHLSYFTPASLDLILRRAGLRPIHVESSRAYMRFPFLSALAVVEAPEESPSAWFQDFSLEPALARVGDDFRRYLDGLARVRVAGPVGVWGTGSIGTQFAIDAGWAEDDAWYVDPNPTTHGLRLSVTGHEVHDPATLDHAEVETILIASGWEQDARAQYESATRVRRPALIFSDLLAA